MLEFINSNTLKNFMPVFILLALIATAVAILVLCNEDDIQSDKYQKARQPQLNDNQSKKSANKEEKQYSFNYFCKSKKCSNEINKIINILYEIFHDKFTIIPNVKIDSIVKAFDSSNIINGDFSNQTMDIGIFNSEQLKPLVLIDLIDKSSSKSKTSKKVLSAMNKLNFKTCEIIIEENYDKDILIQALQKLMPKDI